MKRQQNRGNTKAQYALGVCYYEGEGVKISNTRAIYWFRKLAEKRDVQGYFGLGMCYYEGKGTEQSYEKAIYWFERAAEQGNIEAQYTLGICYYESAESKENMKERATYWLEKACENFNDEACQKLNDITIGHKNRESEVETSEIRDLLQKANKGNSIAQCNLATLYYEGEKIEQSYSKAFYWYKKAAQQGYAKAQFYLGLQYERAEGISYSLSDAIYWYKKALGNGYSDARCFLGNLYFIEIENPEEVMKKIMTKEEYKKYLKEDDTGKIFMFMGAKAGIGKCMEQLNLEYRIKRNKEKLKIPIDLIDETE